MLRQADDVDGGLVERGRKGFGRFKASETGGSQSTNPLPPLPHTPLTRTVASRATRVTVTSGRAAHRVVAAAVPATPAPMMTAAPWGGMVEAMGCVCREGD